MALAHQSSARPAATVLIIASSASLRAGLAAIMRRAGLMAIEAEIGGEAMRLLREGPDLILLDLTVRDMSGFTLLRQVRLVTDAPLIVLSSTENEIETVHALRAGADDVVAKPPTPAVLAARAQALLRRSRPPATKTVLRHGELEIDLSAVTVTVNGRPIHLRPLDFRLLATLVGHPGEVLTPEFLLPAVWGEAPADHDSRIKVAISALRKQLRDAGAELPIETVRGFGYRYAADNLAGGGEHQPRHRQAA